MKTSNNQLFTGLRETPLSQQDIAFPCEDPHSIKDPRKYVTEPNLVTAVNVALTLGMPLLITGEPGCGKSQLAYRVAWELGFHKTSDGESNNTVDCEANVEKFTVKSTTESSDLFYTFDTVGRFHSSKLGEKEGDIDARNYIHYQGLGMAILKAIGPCELTQKIMSPKQYKQLASKPTRSILLIDEIDKAPRDVPNDILNEIEEMTFSIPELQLEQKIGINKNHNQFRPIVFITSNSERSLPEAFLRRCIFYHLGFAKFESEVTEDENTNGQAITIEKILASQFGDEFDNTPLANNTINLIKAVRQQSNSYNKAPSMAEFINLIDFLLQYGHSNGQALNGQQKLTIIDRQILNNAINQTLFKSQDDMLIAHPHVMAWLNE